MNNKGFTLIELLAVIVILLGISLVAVSSISSSLNKREIKECNEQIELAKNAAKIYFSLNEGTTVTIGMLKEQGYFNESNKVSRLKNEDTIVITDGEYFFLAYGECGGFDS